MSATTDSYANVKYDMFNQPGISNLLQIEALSTDTPLEEVVAKWNGETRYGELKKKVAESVATMLENFQKRLAEIPDEEVYALFDPSPALQGLIDETGGRGRQEECEDRCDDGPGHEVRQIDDCLDKFLAEEVQHFVQEDRNDNCNKCVQKQFADGQDKRVDKRRPEFLFRKQLCEVSKTDPVNVSEFIRIERIADTKHRPVVNN
jgi:hypothetical protein